MNSFVHTLANPKELLVHNSFYVEALAKTEDIERVFNQAKGKTSLQFSKAEEIADSIALDPPNSDKPSDLYQYMSAKVLSESPTRLRYDDTFWSCLLHLLDSKNVPLCSIGGPFHKMVYRVYDDFDPSDVTDV